MLYNFFKKKKSIFIISIILLFAFPTINFAKISDKNEVQTFWQQAPILPGAAKYFIRTEKIEKKTKVLNNHPIKISGDILTKMFKQLSYKYDRNEPEIPVFSNKELILLSEYVPQALMNAKPNEDVTFVIKGPHSSTRWSFSEERLTSGRLFVANNQLNLIIGAVQLNLQPTLPERYAGNVWETANLVYDTGRRIKAAEFEGLIVVYNQNKGIYRKSNERKDWFVFTNDAYKAAKRNVDGKALPKKQYETLQQQIDSLQKQLNKKPKQQQRELSPPPTKQLKIERNEPTKSNKQTNVKNNPHAIEQRLKTIENLYKKGMLTEEEYQKKRNSILKGI